MTISYDRTPKKTCVKLEGSWAPGLTAGQTFYEGPNDVHVVGRNASNTKPAKLLVVLVKNKGAPPSGQPHGWPTHGS